MISGDLKAQDYQLNFKPSSLKKLHEDFTDLRAELGLFSLKAVAAELWDLVGRLLPGPRQLVRGRWLGTEPRCGLQILL